MGDGKIMERTDDRVLQIAEAFGADTAAMCALFEAFARLEPTRRQRLFQFVHERPFHGFGLALVARRQLFERPFEARRIDDFEKARHSTAHVGGLRNF